MAWIKFSPEISLLFLVGIFIALMINWQQPNRLLFEIEVLNQLATFVFYATPLLVAVNSLRFRPRSTRIMAHLFAVALLVLVGIIFSFRWLVGDHPELVRCHRQSDGSIISIYQRRERSLFTVGDTMYCRWQMQQKRVFPGILMNVTKLNSNQRDECQFLQNEFSPSLQ
jgi:hypothetical protein